MRSLGMSPAHQQSQQGEGRWDSMRELALIHDQRNRDRHRNRGNKNRNSNGIGFFCQQDNVCVTAFERNRSWGLPIYKLSQHDRFGAASCAQGLEERVLRLILQFPALEILTTTSEQSCRSSGNGTHGDYVSVDEQPSDVACSHESDQRGKVGLSIRNECLDKTVFFRENLAHFSHSLFRYN